MSEIAERLKKLRGSEAQGVFAARLGLKQAVYCHYEKGRREPSLDTLVNIALRLGCSTDWLLGVPGASGPSAPPLTTGDGSPVINGGVNGSGNIVGNSINVTPPPVNITISITVNINGQEEEGEEMSEEKQPKERPGTTALKA